ncbi:hypothetical protein OXPF_05250 [Oxobacter pfennigii]|uniref:Uncharacterized protein n=1 Tax=Oxobacter pfennigii TaxID=36849 RepID=A0A0P8Z1S7_9CLOT|nr:hypothetical protein [Oxobacter pfennigii]KPU46044.1 hypothetical protein OXPF_05250 [Oxobacter pfennigii]
MNLGSFFSTNNSGNNGLFGNNKTILIILIVVVVIFGFGYGRGMFGFGGSPAAKGFQAYGFIDPKSKRSRRRHDDGYSFGYGQYGYPGAGAPLSGFASPYGGFFGNDWWFIIAIIGLLFLLGEDNANDNNNAANINANVCC